MRLTNAIDNVLIDGLEVRILGSATGDLYYLDASGAFTRLPIGTAGQYLGVSGGIPAWLTLILALNSVTLGTLQQISSSSILGRSSAGSGSVEELTPAAARLLLGLGSAALHAAGRAAGNVPVLDASGKLPTEVLPPEVTMDSEPVNYSRLVGSPRIIPSQDSVTAVQVLKANGATPLVTIDSLNGYVGIGPAQTALKSPLEVFSSTSTEPLTTGGIMRFGTNTGVNDRGNKFGAIAGEQGYCYWQSIRPNIANDGIISLNPIGGAVGVRTTAPAATLEVNGSFRLTPISSSPLDPVEGTLYYDKTMKKLRVYDGTNWQNCW